MIKKHLYAINIYCKDKKINFGHISKDEQMHKISTNMHEYEEIGDRVKDTKDRKCRQILY